jgi:hypothetical protein
LYKKSYGKESKLSYLGHALVENRNGLIAAATVTHADGYAERDAALLMLDEKQRGRSRRITVGADKAFERIAPEPRCPARTPERQAIAWPRHRVHVDAQGCRALGTPDHR